MTHAFDGGAFDDVAFDVGDVTTTAGFYLPNMWTSSGKRPESDDDLFLAAWFMFMRQPHDD
jgi:hypothetical protein